MSVTLQQVEDALDSVPATDGVLVVQVREDGSTKRLAQRDPVPNYPARIIVLSATPEATPEAVSRPHKPVDHASPGDTPPTDESRGHDE